MRAMYFPFNPDSLNSRIVISGEAAHHLNVVRLRMGDDLLLLNGVGARLITKVVAIEKKQLVVEGAKLSVEEKKANIGLVIACPKKEAFEDILKIAVEMGITTIYPVSSHYSQYEFLPSERCLKLIESALIQSNNSWLPELKAQSSLDEFLKSASDPLFFFNSKPVQISTKEIATIPEAYNFLIGPEGGFSPGETSLIIANNKTIEVYLPTPILRAPTAVAASFGYLMALKSKASPS